MNKLFSLALVTFLFAACNTSGSRKVETTAPPASSAQTPGADSTGTITNTPPAFTAPATDNSDAQVAVNPAHGAPGHRCEIPVGAPLNTPAGSTPAVTNINPAPVMISPQAPSLPANNVRLNPAHGAPGHDCSIPVGQPLRS